MVGHLLIFVILARCKQKCQRSSFIFALIAIVDYPSYLTQFLVTKLKIPSIWEFNEQAFTVISDITINS